MMPGSVSSNVKHYCNLDFSNFNGKNLIESQTLIFIGFSVDSFQIPISPPHLEKSRCSSTAFFSLSLL